MSSNFPICRRSSDLVRRPRHLTIVLISIFAIASGMNEVVVGLTGNFLGILSKAIPPSSAAVVVGAFYNLAGLSLLTMKKWGAVLGTVFLSAEILGRIYLVVAGIAPSKGGDAVKILIGGLIALALLVYVGFQWKKFDRASLHCVTHAQMQVLGRHTASISEWCPRANVFHTHAEMIV
jgi:hypothetical protein